MMRISHPKTWLLKDIFKIVSASKILMILVQFPSAGKRQGIERSRGVGGGELSH